MPITEKDIIPICEKLSSHNVQIQNNNEFVQAVHDDLEALKKSVGNMNVKLAIVATASFLGSAFGNNISNFIVSIYNFFISSTYAGM